MSPTTEVLVVGYGNELRGDDGLGPRVARAIEDLGLPDVRVLAVPQLTPDLAEPISQCARVVFIDAAVHLPVAVSVHRLKVPHAGNRPFPSTNLDPHTSNPLGLLHLAGQLFGYCPTAFLVTIAATDLGVGMDLSEPAQAVLTRAVCRVRHLCSDSCPRTRTPRNRGEAFLGRTAASCQNRS